jgi:hypothetical protein
MIRVNRLPSVKSGLQGRVELEIQSSVFMCSGPHHCIPDWPREKDTSSPPRTPTSPHRRGPHCGAASMHSRALTRGLAWWARCQPPVVLQRGLDTAELGQENAHHAWPADEASCSR